MVILKILFGKKFYYKKIALKSIHLNKHNEKVFIVNYI